jgi:hypothetical protein
MKRTKTNKMSFHNLVKGQNRPETYFHNLVKGRNTIKTGFHNLVNDEKTLWGFFTTL